MTDYDDDDRGQDAGEYGVGDGADDNPGPAGTWHPDPNDQDRIIAKGILLETATVLCSTTLFETPALPGGRLQQLCAWLFEEECLEHDPDAHHHRNCEVELSEPTIRPPTETVRDQRHRKRVNEEIGYISGGYSTGVIVKPRSKEELAEVLDEWLDGRKDNVSEEIKQDAREKLFELKRAGDHSDVDILTIVIAFVRSEEKREIMQMISRLEDGGQMSEAVSAMKAAAAGYR
ncbi:hypothetical protein [Halolamina sp. R1-12]|nr:hypothetical protein [Halolamina sp. R1-12]